MPYRMQEKASDIIYRIMNRKATWLFERNPSLGIKDPAEWRRRVHRELIYLWARNLMRKTYKQNEAQLRREIEQIKAAVDHMPGKEETRLRRYLKNRLKEALRRKKDYDILAEDFLPRVFNVLFSFDRWLKRKKYSIFERGKFSIVKYLARFDQFAWELFSKPKDKKQKYRRDLLSAFEHCVTNYPNIVAFANFAYNFLEKARKSKNNKAQG